MKLRHGRIYCPENSILLSDLKSPVLLASENLFPHILIPPSSPHNSFECVKLSFIRSETNFGGDPIGH